MADDTEHSDFVQKLIDAVRRCRCLYDKKHIAYFNRREREKAWRLIGQQLGRSDVDCHKRWKLLREKLAKELKKRDKALENGEPFQSDWACFESIMFVEDHISPRKKLEKLPLLLAKDLSKKRSSDDSDAKSYVPAEKRAYSAEDFNFFMQLSTATVAGNASQINENPSCSVVKSEPIDKQSDDSNSLSANENASNASTSSSFNDQEMPGTLDLTKAVDVLLKDLRDKKETSFNFMNNLTNALKIKDLDIFKYESPSNPQQQIKIQANSNDYSKMGDSDFDDDEDNLPNNEDSNEAQLQRAYNINYLNNGFMKHDSLSPIAKTCHLGAVSNELKPNHAVKIQLPVEVTNRSVEKDELFGKLVTSMLADITDEEYKDDAKFSIMQLLVNAKRACRAK